MGTDPAGRRTSRYLAATAVGRVEVLQRELEPLAAGHLRVATEVSMVSPGTELHFVADTHTIRAKYPMQIGYCIVGTVEAVGAAVTGWTAGDRCYVLYPHADVFDVPADVGDHLLVRLPRGIDATRVAPLAPLGVALRGVRAGAVRFGDAVAIYGQGLIGVLTTLLARRSGAHPVIAVDPVASRRELALKLGADVALDPSGGDVTKRVRELTGGRGVEVSIEATATTRVLGQLPEATATEGRIVVLGGIHGRPDLDLYTHFMKRNQTLIGCGSPFVRDYPFTAARNYEALIQQIQAGRLDATAVLTRTLPAAQATEAYRMLLEEKDKLVSVLFDWTGG